MSPLLPAIGHDTAQWKSIQTKATALWELK